MAARGLPEQVTPHCPRPVRRPVMLQGWHDLASLHWPYDPAVVQLLLPHGFRVDTFDDRAWVGLLPFHMRRIRVPGLPPLGPQSTFPETNVRTYVVDPRGRRGVWFASLDITRLAATLVARTTYGLPYCWASMSIERRDDVWTYRSIRRWPRATRPDAPPASTVSLRVGPALHPDEVSELDHFLSARWALGSTFLGRRLWAEVDHPPWPLHAAEALLVDETMVQAAGLPAPAGSPHVLWSPGVEVRIGRPQQVRDGPGPGR